jgi:anti-sigma factor RsiW
VEDPKLKCSGLLRDLVDYLDGELAPELVERLEEHLCDCIDCRVVVDTTRKTVEVYRQTEAVPLPEDLRQRLYQLFTLAEATSSDWSRSSFPEPE